MNTKNLKAYAPKARRQFIEAVQKRAAHFGIYEDRIVEAKEEGSSILIEGRVFTKQQGQQRKRLAQRVAERGYEMFTREMAYTWFNRLAAIRYMEIHDYLEHGFRVLSNPNNNESLPEILDHASDVADTLELDKSHIIELQLAGDKEEELYRELLLGQCHHLYKVMPFMFEEIDDATELLLPDNLTKTDSILKGLINDIPEEDWKEIEVIGWLYQAYISEHKDSVIGKVVKSEDIPAATQLFTPNWIVKYLVQNSLGRHWLATYPGSELKGKMEYYIEPAKQSDDVIEQLKAITPASIDPEEIKIIDPAVGSGHILVEVYDVLREIYLERGYRLREIPELILTKNIYGLDIDDRAAQLAGFALMMKAREDDRRIFQRVQDGEVTLNIYSLQSTENLDVPSLWRALDLERNQQQGSTGGLFDASEGFIEPSGIYKEYYQLLQTLKSAFLQAKTLGSLIEIDTEHLANLIELKELLQAKEQGSDPSAKEASVLLLPIIRQSIAISLKYQIVTSNPPYMGGKGMNADIKKFVQTRYPNSKTDLFSVYIERCLDLGTDNSEIGMVTPYVWMFIGSYEGIRNRVINHHTLTNLIQLEYNAFAPACIPVCTFTFSKHNISSFRGSYIKLTDFKGADSQPIKTLEAINNNNCGWFFTSCQDSFSKIPGSPIGYWLDETFFSIFDNSKRVGSVADAKQGLATAENERFLRRWHEVDTSSSNLLNSENRTKWIKHNKGGAFRRWYGNNEWVVNWEAGGREIKEFGTENGGRPRSRVQNFNYYFKKGITWSDLTSSLFASRYVEEGYIFDITGPSLFTKDVKVDDYFFLGYTNSSVFQEFLNVSLQGMHYSNGVIANMPCTTTVEWDSSGIHRLVEIYKDDWNQQETSFQFTGSKLRDMQKKEIRSSVESFINQQSDILKEAIELETNNNSYFAKAYGLEKIVQFRPEEKRVTLFSNTSFRYRESDTNINNERFYSELIAEEMSFSVGCMMGRYSLDREGLTYAHSGNEGFKELISEGVYQTFPADDDGIVPLASEEWLFDDDATTRFKEFVKTVWCDEFLNENLEFVAESLCLHALKPKKGEGAMDTVRRYFSTQFFKDHCKTYKKRPIYWLFSSGKEKAFECLVYLHRYNEGTLSRMRTEYVTPLMGKYDHMLNHLADKLVDATSSEKRNIEKEQKSLTKKQAELRTFDEQLKHYAEMRISLDLDDGVKANYGKFGNLLADVKAIHGSAPKVVK